MKTARYPHGDLPLDTVIEFLVGYKEEPLPPTKKMKKRGELNRIRGALRSKYPGWQTNTLMLKKALASKAEWAEWRKQLINEREEKQDEKREKKAVRALARQQKESRKVAELVQSW